MLRGSMAAGACVLIAALALQPAQAEAGPSCGVSGGGSSGGSSSGGSSGGGGGGGGGGSSSSSSSTPACDQTTSIVGRAECRNFGDGWDRSWQPRIRLSAGVVHSSVSLSNIELEGDATHDGVSHGYHYDPRMVDGSSPQAELIGGTFDIHFLIRQAHLGFGMAIAAGSSDGAEQINAQGLRMRSGLALQMEAKAVAGYATRMGKWGVVGELQTGMRVTSVEVETRLEDCIAESMSSHLGGILRPSVTVQRWLSPWLTTDLNVGSDLLQDRDLTMTLSLTAHSRSYDGI